MEERMPETLALIQKAKSDLKEANALCFNEW